MSLSKMSSFDIPISIRWKVSKATIELQNPGLWYLPTEEFHIDQLPGVIYYLVLACTLNNVTMGLIIETEEPSSMKISCKLAIPSVNRTDQGSKESTGKKHIMASDIASADDILDTSNNYFINDDLIILMEAVLTVEKPTPAVADFQMKGDSLGPLLWERENKDFTIVVDGKQVMAHKLVIGTKSPVFNRMIQSGLAETQENKVAIIDFGFDIVELAIRYCYGMDDGKLLTTDTAFELMRFADKYDIGDLKASMEKYLASQISPMNVGEIANASVLCNAVNLRKRCLDFMLESNQQRTFITNLDQLDEDFSLALLQASFSN